MRIVLIDPSLFTLPYDNHLAQGLAAHGDTNITLYGRTLRIQEEIHNTSYTFEPFFYKYSEKISPKKLLGKKLKTILKPIEHCYNSFRLCSILCKNKPDVIHYQWIPLPLIDLICINIFKKCGIAVVLTVHDTNPFNGSPTSRIQNIGWKRTLYAGDELIVHTQKSVEVLQKLGYALHKINVIPHGIFDFGKPQEISVLTRNPIILFFGTIKPYKGVDILLEAFAKIKDKTNAVVHITGQARHGLDTYINLATKLKISDRVIFDSRFISDHEIPSILHNANLLVFPYREIDASGVFFTALNYNTPFIASNIGIFKEQLHPYPECLFEKENIDDMAEKMLSAINNPAYLNKLKKIITSVRQTIPSWENIGMMTITTYKKAINRPKHPIIFLENDFSVDIEDSTIIQSSLITHSKFKRLIVNIIYFLRLGLIQREATIIAPWGLFWIPGLWNKSHIKKFKIISLSCDTFLSIKTSQAKYKSFLGFSKYLLAKSTYKTVSNFICCSDIVQEQMETFGVQSDVCNLRYREWVRNKKRYARFQHIIPNIQDNTFIFIGHCYNSMQKRVDLLVEAFAKTHPNTTHSKLIIIGRGWDKFFNTQQKEYYTKNNIHFIGETYDLDEFLKQSAFVIHPGELEGFGLSVIECMLAGLIPLVSNQTGSKDAVIQLNRELIFELTEEALIQKILWVKNLTKEQRIIFSHTARTIGASYSEDKSVPALREKLTHLL